MQAVKFTGAKRLQCCSWQTISSRLGSSQSPVSRKSNNNNNNDINHYYYDDNNIYSSSSCRSSCGSIPAANNTDCWHHHGNKIRQHSFDSVQQIRKYYTTTTTTIAATSDFITTSTSGKICLASTCLMRSYDHRQQRHLSSQQQEEKVAVSKSVDTKSSTSNDSGVEARHNIRPRNVDKWMLVYTKTYPNKESIPDVVPTRKMASSRDKVRARLAVVLGVVSLACMFIVSAVASKARRAGTGLSLKQYTNDQMGSDKK